MAKTKIKFARIKSRLDTGEFLYEIWNHDKETNRGGLESRHIGYITRAPFGGWEVNLETPKGPKIRRHTYLRSCKQFAIECYESGH